MKNVPFSDVRVTGGFWKQKQDLVRSVTINAVYDRFKESGRFDAFRFDPEGTGIRPHVFWDSDVAKWLESVAYLTAQQKDPALEAKADELIDEIAAHQAEDGYFNLYSQQIEPEKRFTDRGKHELYCLGHLIEAAVAYYRATGKKKLLDCVEKYTDFVYDLFVVRDGASFVTPGHEEIELALISLYRLTRNKKHLELCRFFLDERARHPDRDPGAARLGMKYNQSHLPVREQRTAVGHAVRACYLYSGMADFAKETGDKEMEEACRALFDDIVNTKLYITGGIGACHVGERFGAAYYLPNDTAYAETCAGISLAMFASRMQQFSSDVRLADTIERVYYNNVLSGLSQDGEGFFYVNPLELAPQAIKVMQENGQPVPRSRRPKIFSCSCCPPNITRMIPTFQQYAYTVSEDTVYVHQFLDSEATVAVGGRTVTLRQETDYPVSGKVKLTVKGYTGKLAVRVPSWSSEYAEEKKDGYLRFDVAGDAEISLDFKPAAELIAADPRVADDCGRVAVCRGPVVYCLEEADNGPMLRDVRISADGIFAEGPSDEFGLPVLLTEGWRSESEGGLYRPYTGSLKKVPLRFIPYQAFANREEGEMLVWVLVKE